jgi:hypothetical protein
LRDLRPRTLNRRTIIVKESDTQRPFLARTAVADGGRECLEAPSSIKQAGTSSRRRYHDVRRPQLTNNRTTGTTVPVSELPNHGHQPCSLEDTGAGGHRPVRGPGRTAGSSAAGTIRRAPSDGNIERRRGSTNTDTDQRAPDKRKNDHVYPGRDPGVARRARCL